MVTKLIQHALWMDITNPGVQLESISMEMLAPCGENVRNLVQVVHKMIE